MNISFVVYGQPQTAGSKRAFVLKRKDGSLVTRSGGQPVVNVTDDNAKSRSWKQEVASAARQTYRGALLDAPLSLILTFYRPRPKGHLRAGGALSKAGLETPYPTAKPDVLKLARAVEDALTGVIWRDDAQIVVELLHKRWGEPARVEVTISDVGPVAAELLADLERPPMAMPAVPETPF